MKPRAAPLLVGPLAGLLAFVCGLPYWREHVPAALMTCLGCAGFAAAGGLLAGSADGRRRSGTLLVTGAFCVALAWVVTWNSGIWPLVSFLAQGSAYVLSGAAVLLYPGGRLTGRAERAWVVCAVVVLIGGQVVVGLVSRPEWNGLHPDVVWPNVASQRRVFDLTVEIVIVAQLLLVVWYLVVLVRRARRLSELERSAMLPLLLATGFFGVGAAVLTTGSDAWTELDALLSFYVVVNLLAMAVPLAVLSGALRERWREVDAPHRVVRMTSSTSSVGSVRDALAAALRDPRLRLLFWVPAERSYVDRWGRLVGVPRAAAGRWWAEVRVEEGQPLALVELDEGLRGVRGWWRRSCGRVRRRC